MTQIPNVKVSKKAITSLSLVEDPPLAWMGEGWPARHRPPGEGKFGLVRNYQTCLNHWNFELGYCLVFVFWCLEFFQS